MNSRLPELENIEIYSEDGMREFIKKYQAYCKDLALQAHWAAGVLRPRIATLPSIEEAGKVVSLLSGSGSKHYARIVTAYMLRSGEAQVVAAGQMGASWGAMERYFLGPAAQAQAPSFKVNKPGNARRRRAG